MRLEQRRIHGPEGFGGKALVGPLAVPTEEAKEYSGSQSLMLALVVPPQDLLHPPWGSPESPLSQSLLGLPRDK